MKTEKEIRERLAALVKKRAEAAQGHEDCLASTGRREFGALVLSLCHEIATLEWTLGDS